MTMLSQKPDEALKGLLSHLAVREPATESLKVLMIPRRAAYSDLVAEQTRINLVWSTGAANQVSTVSPGTILHVSPFVGHVWMLGEERPCEALKCTIKSSHVWQQPNGPRVSCGDCLISAQSDVP
jgi:hypothetical protein